MSESRFTVEIGPREIYDKVLETATEVRLVRADLSHMAEKDNDFEARLRAIESRRLPPFTVQVVTAIVAVGGLALGVVQLLIK